MRMGGLAALGALFIAGTLSAQPALCQQSEKPQAGQEAMEAAWLKAGTPGGFHKHLEAMQGTWSIEGKSWTELSPEPMTWTGTATKTMIMGGRFLREGIESEMMGKPFNGLGFMGYDNLAEKYWYFWLDDMSTGVMTSEGECDKSGATFTIVGDYIDPMTGQSQKAKTVIKVLDENKHLFEMYMVSPEGEESKSMEITYLRK